MTPFDGTDTGEAKSTSVMVGNSPPEVVSAAVVPDLVFTNDEVAVEYATADLDGGFGVSVAIQWLVNGEPVAEGTTLSGTEYFEKGDAISAVLIDDGFEEGEAFETAAIIVQNTPPTAPVITITGSPRSTRRVASAWPSMVTGSVRSPPIRTGIRLTCGSVWAQLLRECRARVRSGGPHYF